MQLTKPRGTLIPIGGGNDGNDILDRVIKETGRSRPELCYITVALSSTDEARQKHKNFAREIKKCKVTLIHFNTRSEADSRENLEKIRNCNAILIGGGNQLRLSSLLGGTRLITEIRKRYYSESRFVVSGNSAGAAAMSTTMIISGSSQDALVKGQLQLTNGLDLINNVFIDTHFTDRGRFGRLIQTVAYNPGILGLGLSTDTAAVIYEGERLEVVGSGLAVIVDGTAIEYSNLTEISDGEPITIQGLKVHVLGSGKCFLVNKRIVLSAILKKIGNKR